MRPVTERDRLTLADVETPEGRHAIQGPDGRVIVPRPREGCRFVRWETRAALNEEWQPVPVGGQVQRFVRAHYARRPG